MVPLAKAILKELRERPRIKIMQGIYTLAPGPHFVATYRGQEFVLTPVSFGLKMSLHSAFRACGEHLRDQWMERRMAA